MRTVVDEEKRRVPRQARGKDRLPDNIHVPSQITSAPRDAFFKTPNAGRTAVNVKSTAVFSIWQAYHEQVASESHGPLIQGSRLRDPQRLLELPVAFTSNVDINIGEISPADGQCVSFEGECAAKVRFSRDDGLFSNPGAICPHKQIYKRVGKAAWGSRCEPIAIERHRVTQ